MAPIQDRQVHSPAWIAQCWISFAVSIAATGFGIFWLPADAWQKGYLAMGLTFSVGSTISLSKTIRDVHEAQKLVAKVEEAKMEKLLTTHQL
ncbi:MAG: hypothetical protein MH825_15580 [Cyanobacteria bacterium]|nr:hypothetical protein [Cyanobacteriota bacterium]